MPTISMPSMAKMAEELKSAPYYHPKLKTVSPTLIKVLGDRGITEAEIEDHVETVRNKAWQIFPYPCIGMFTFTTFPMTHTPFYEELISRTQAGETVLDLGCGFAQDFRNLISMGVDSSHLVGIDNHDSFFSLGYDLFCDKDIVKARFVVADMLDLSSIPSNLLGTFDIVWAGASFHLFDWDDQVKASIVAVELLKPNADVLVVGYQVGCEKGESRANPYVPSTRMYLHDTESFDRLWKEVGEKTNTQWRVQSWLDDKYVDDLKVADKSVMRLCFRVERELRSTEINLESMTKIKIPFSM